MKRTKIDFSRHEVEIIQHEGVLIHKFKRPDTIVCSIIFINTQGVMTVTGYFGNWVFNREFHPHADYEGVSDYYWNEKLEMYSQQTSSDFDTETTLEHIQEFIDDYEENYQPVPEELNDWFEELKDNAFDKIEYEYVAYRNKPSDIECEDVPYGKKQHQRLSCVYDGFEALCEKLKEKQ